jgi:hypothetical protein
MMFLIEKSNGFAAWAADGPGAVAPAATTAKASVRLSDDLNTI